VPITIVNRTDADMARVEAVLDNLPTEPSYAKLRQITADYVASRTTTVTAPPPANASAQQQSTTTTTKITRTKLRSAASKTVVQPTTTTAAAAAAVKTETTIFDVANVDVILLEMLDYMDSASLLALQQTCRRFYAVVDWYLTSVHNRHVKLNVDTHAYDRIWRIFDSMDIQCLNRAREHSWLQPLLADMGAPAKHICRANLWKIFGRTRSTDASMTGPIASTMQEEDDDDDDDDDEDDDSSDSGTDDDDYYDNTTSSDEYNSEHDEFIPSSPQYDPLGVSDNDDFAVDAMHPSITARQVDGDSKGADDYDRNVVRTILNNDGTLRIERLRQCMAYAHKAYRHRYEPLPYDDTGCRISATMPKMPASYDERVEPGLHNGADWIVLSKLNFGGTKINWDAMSLRVRTCWTEALLYAAGCLSRALFYVGASQYGVKREHLVFKLARVLRECLQALEPIIRPEAKRLKRYVVNARFIYEMLCMSNPLFQVIVPTNARPYVLATQSLIIWTLCDALPAPHMVCTGRLFAEPWFDTTRFYESVDVTSATLRPTDNIDDFYTWTKFSMRAAIYIMLHQNPIYPGNNYKIEYFKYTDEAAKPLGCTPYGARANDADVQSWFSPNMMIRFQLAPIAFSPVLRRHVATVHQAKQPPKHSWWLYTSGSPVNQYDDWFFDVHCNPRYGVSSWLSAQRLSGVLKIVPEEQYRNLDAPDAMHNPLGHPPAMISIEHPTIVVVELQVLELMRLSFEPLFRSGCMVYAPNKIPACVNVPAARANCSNLRAWLTNRGLTPAIGASGSRNIISMTANNFYAVDVDLTAIMFQQTVLTHAWSAHHLQPLTRSNTTGAPEWNEPIVMSLLKVISKIASCTGADTAAEQHLRTSDERNQRWFRFRQHLFDLLKCIPSTYLHWVVVRNKEHITPAMEAAMAKLSPELHLLFNAKSTKSLAAVDSNTNKRRRLNNASS
jgi:hypothetical protein